VLVGAKPVAVGSETPCTNHNLTTSNEKNKHLEEVCTSAEIPEDNHSNGKVTTSQIARPAADSSKTGSNIKPAIFVESGSTTEAIDETLLCNQSSAQKKNSRSAFGSKEALDHRSQHDNVKECSQTSHNRKIADNNDSQAAASVHVLQPENSKTPVRVEVEKSKTKPVDDYSIQRTKPVPSVSTDSNGSSVLGRCLVEPDPLKRADNLPEISSKTSVRAGSAANSFASSLKKIVKQQTAAKVVRHYPSESVNKLKSFYY
jgi:ubiquitin carboxyl-terminal hydrolase 36/42